MINFVHDRSGIFHTIPSYVLKTILFRQIEKKRELYWAQDDVLETFFIDLLDDLKQCMETKKCSMYWNPSINLLSDMSQKDFSFILRRIEIISNNISAAIADDWLELQRCVRINCCGCCVLPEYKRNVVETETERHHCITIPCSYGSGLCCGNLLYDENMIYVY